MDVFVEYMVKRKMGVVDYAIMLGTIVLGVTLTIAAFLFLPLFIGATASTVVLMIAAGAIFGIYWVIGSRNLEFEYAVTNGDVSVDKIMNRKSRKRLTSFDTKSIEEIGKYADKAEALKNRRFDKQIFAGADSDGKDGVYVVVNSKKTGMTLVVFDPSQKVLDAMKPFVPRHLRQEFYGR